MTTQIDCIPANQNIGQYLFSDGGPEGPAPKSISAANSPVPPFILPSQPMSDAGNTSNAFKSQIAAATYYQNHGPKLLANPKVPNPSTTNIEKLPSGQANVKKTSGFRNTPSTLSGSNHSLSRRKTIPRREHFSSPAHSEPVSGTNVLYILLVVIFLIIAGAVIGSLVNSP
tara:strand:+ start:117 stop:629 length:513 start_codon:yes stop_codon:yes gene_type:complete